MRGGVHTLPIGGRVASGGVLSITAAARSVAVSVWPAVGVDAPHGLATEMAAGVLANGITVARCKSISGVSWRIDLCCPVIAASLWPWQNLGPSHQNAL